MRDILFSALFLYVNLLAMFSVVLLVEVPFGMKMKVNAKRLTVAGVLFVLMEIVLGHVLQIGDAWLFLAEYLFMVTSVCVMATEKRVKAAFMTIPAVFVYYHWTTLFELVEIMSGMDRFYFVEQDINIRPMMAVDSLFLVILLLLLKRYANRKFMKISLTLGEGILLVVAGIFSQVGVIFLATIDEMFHSSLFNLGWVVFLLLLNIALIYSIIHRKRVIYYKKLSESYKTQFEKEYTYFKEYKKSNVETIRFRHDWNNHMIVMQRLLDEGNYEDAKKYFDSFSKPVFQKRKSELTGNETADIILAAKADQLEEQKIEFEMEGSLKCLDKMEPVDICILFANLIDNAIEACVKVDIKKCIRIKATESPNVFMIRMQNSAQEILQDENGEMLTTKADKNLHGIGLQNVENVLEKYNGEYKIDFEEGMFCIHLILPI